MEKITNTICELNYDLPTQKNNCIINHEIILKAGKNTRFAYEIIGINDNDMAEVNAIDKTVTKDYMIARMEKLFKIASAVKYSGMRSSIFENNLIMIDGHMPELYGDMILNHYRFIADKIYDCGMLLSILEKFNPMGYGKSEIYEYKFKKLLCAAALGMTPGTEWDGLDNASGGYIIIKKDGDVLCYHLYNRNFFEEYLLRNTFFDRPGASRHDYGYIYKDGEKYLIDLNIQIRFKSIAAASKEYDFDDNMLNRIEAYIKGMAR